MIAIHSQDAEESVIGAALIYHDECADAFERLKPEHFYEPVRSRIWARMLAQRSKSGFPDVISVADAMGEDEAFVTLGGRAYLADLVAEATAWTVAAHVDAVLDRAVRRQVQQLATEIGARAPDTADSTGEALIGEMERSLADLAHNSGAPSAWRRAGVITAEALATAKAQKGLVGLSTGLHDLDGAIGGLRKGQMIVVAGRPAMGKSSAALQIAKAVARKGRGAAFFSMEMPDFDLGLRMACDVAHDPLALRYAGQSSNPHYFDAARGRLTAEQWWKLDAAKDEIDVWPLLIDVRPGLTTTVILNAARRQFRTWERAGVEPGCIIVDHLTIARPEKERGGNKVAEVGDISRALAEMAKTLDVPVVALCQLSRDVEKRDRDKRPTLSDLRWSGEIEQDARVVAFLYRPEYYLRKPEDPTDFEGAADHQEKLDKVRNRLFWLVEKNNNGPTGQVETYCDIACSAIRDRLGGHP